MLAYRGPLILSLLKIVVSDVNILPHETLTRRSSFLDSLPEIRDGDPCVPGQMYKMECNTCRCSPKQSLMCTMKGCIDWRSYITRHGEKKALKASNKKGKTYLPKVKKGVQCKPGKLYRIGCKRCFCTEEHMIICSKKQKEACTFDKQGRPPPIKIPEDVRPAIKKTEHKDLDILLTGSQQCKPGKSYMVDCNYCICLETSNLICEMKLCLSYEDMNRLVATEMSGKPCSEEENSLERNSCIKCDCVAGKTDCLAIPHCREGNLQLLRGNGPLEEFDPNSGDKCVPYGVYRVDCNKCICQPDFSLRCTQKKCLNHSKEQGF